MVNVQLYAAEWAISSNRWFHVVGSDVPGRVSARGVRIARPGLFIGMVRRLLPCAAAG